MFAPVAANLAAGVPLASLGSPLDPASLVLLPPLPLTVEPGVARGSVAGFDHFGNAVTNLTQGHLAGLGARPRVCVEGHSLGQIEETFGSVAPGSAVAVVGSSGRLELAVNGGSARDTLALSVGAPVEVRRI